MLQIDKKIRQQWQELIDKRAYDLDVYIGLFQLTNPDSPWFYSKNMGDQHLDVVLQAVPSAGHHISFVFGTEYASKIFPIVDLSQVVVAHVIISAASSNQDALESLELDTLAVYIQQQLYERQRQSEPLSALSLQEFLNSLDDHYWIKDLKGVYRYTNPRAKTNLGMSPEDIVGKTDNDLFDAETADMFIQADFKTIRERKQIIFPRYVRYISGSEKTWAESMKCPLFNKGGEIIGIVGSSRDVVDNKDRTKQLFKLAYFDSLTELSNRTHLMFELNKKIKFAEQNKTQLALLSVDIDFFQRINESFSHRVADSVLIKVAQRLKKNLASHALLARIDGDEFAVAFISEDARREANEWGSQIQKLFHEPFQLSGNREIRLSVSVGMAVYPENGISVDEILSHANAALTRAKQLGRNRREFYTNALNYVAERQVQLQEYLYRALKENFFHLVYQEKVSLSNQEVFGYEALLRLDIPAIGLISPVEFIPVAEASGLIIDIGTWVLEQACSQAMRWIETGHPFEHIAVNVSAAQLNNGDFVDRVQFILDMTQLPADKLQLEITESMLMENTDQVIETLNQITALGIKLAMDDFGTGYSSLSYLKDLPLSQLKIDRTFIQSLEDEALHGDNVSMKAIVQATIAMAKAFRLSIVAEGIEEEAQAEILKELGCEYGQGFLYHKPERFS